MPSNSRLRRAVFAGRCWWRSAKIAPIIAGICLLPLTLMAGAAPAADTAQNDYPTEARADYVFGCMEANGVSRDTLRRCSCSIDVVASILPYDKYVDAETILGVGQVGGDKSAIFHNPAMNETVAELRRAQAEGEIRCF